MKSKTKNVLDDLDIKCLNELPILLEVLAATGNKLGRIFSPINEDVTEYLNANRPRGWEIDKKRFINTYYPLTSEEYGIKKITLLEPYFAVYNYLSLVKKEENKLINQFSIEFGFVYEEDTGMPSSCYYFSITREAKDKYGGYINDIGFYQIIGTKLKELNEDYEVKIEHPSQGDGYEYLSISSKEHSTEKIELAYSFFKDEVLTPFLEKIK